MADEEPVKSNFVTPREGQGSERGVAYLGGEKRPVEEPEGDAPTDQSLGGTETGPDLTPEP